jgi:hypothetical protein
MVAITGGLRRKEGQGLVASAPTILLGAVAQVGARTASGGAPSGLYQRIMDAIP